MAWANDILKYNRGIFGLFEGSLPDNEGGRGFETVGEAVSPVNGPARGPGTAPGTHCRILPFGPGKSCQGVRITLPSSDSILLLRSAVSSMDAGRSILRCPPIRDPFRDLIL